MFRCSKKNVDPIRIQFVEHISWCEKNLFDDTRLMHYQSAINLLNLNKDACFDIDYLYSLLNRYELNSGSIIKNDPKAQPLFIAIHAVIKEKEVALKASYSCSQR